MASNQKVEEKRPSENFILPTGRGFRPFMQPVYTRIQHVYYASDWYYQQHLLNNCTESNINPILQSTKLTCTYIVTIF